VERVSYEPEGNSAFRADPRVFPQIGWQGLNEFFPTHRELARIAHAGREREPDPGREIRFDRNVWFVDDSPLEGNGFELPVPRAMQGRPRAIIAGFGCKPPSLDYLRLPSVDITEGGPKRNPGTEALSRAEPEVRIHFPPAKSPLRTLSRGITAAGHRQDRRIAPSAPKP